ncbi:MAG: Unknown protein [uncultured Campylobacterales bacterium]|uniref:Histidine-specific methyltransferase SAM-dependent domain-containing protein n=1 Tax=uncultured Campylobacterales bacterium TaxID=352960 RepID=A0A6S6TDS3_9BACT|nr:MAG: Unknown protein [uncultured Campylobacterales bacterium]
MSIEYSYYTTKKDLDKEYLTSLQLRSISPKYRFIGKKQSQARIDMYSSNDSKYYINPKTFMDDVKTEISEYLAQNINVIALGSSNGNKDKILLEELTKTKQASFVAVEISKELASYTLSNMNDLDIHKEVFVSDLIPENLSLISESIRESHFKTHLFTILGNTFGNNPQELISETLRDSINSDDYVLIEVHLSPDRLTPKYIQKIINAYDNEVYNEQVMLSLGRVDISTEDGYLEVEFEHDKLFPEIDSIKHYFRFSKPKMIRFMGKDLYFAKDERILVNYSNKYKLNNFKDLLKSHGFSINKEFLDENKQFGIFLCKLR